MQYIKDPQKKSEDFLGHFMRNDDGTYIWSVRYVINPGLCFAL